MQKLGYKSVDAKNWIFEHIPTLAMSLTRQSNNPALSSPDGALMATERRPWRRTVEDSGQRDEVQSLNMGSL